MHDDNTRRDASRGSSLGADADATPADLRRVERLLNRLGAHERAAAPFGMEDRIALGAGETSRSLSALAAAEGAMADTGLEMRVYAATHPVVREAAAGLGEAIKAPAGLEERIFQATRGTIAGGASARRAGVAMRIGAWSARLAAVLALGGGVWLAWSSFRGEASPPDVTPPLVIAAAETHDDLSFDEFDDVLESHMAFMQTVEYQPADVNVLDEDWCTSCELIEIEEEISS